MSVENTQRDDETTVLPVADEEETAILPAVESDSNSTSEETITTDAAITPVTESTTEQAADGKVMPEKSTIDGDMPQNPADTQASSPEVEAAGSAFVAEDVPVDEPAASVEPSTGTTDAPGAADATASPSVPPILATPAPTAAPKEAPANGVRVAQLVWAGLVIMLGIFMIAISFLRFISIPLLLISLIAALGIALMAAAVVTSVKKG